MGKPLAHELSQQAVNALERFGGVQKAADFLEMSRTTLQSRLKVAARYGIKPKPAPAPVIKEIPPKKPIVRVQAGTDHEARYRVLAIGDAHDSPSIPKDRFRWMGRHAQAMGADYVVQIGDFFTLDSLNTHIPNDTLMGKQKNAYSLDLESAEQAMAEFDKGLSGHRPKMHVTMGNHERRAWFYEERNPETQNLLVGPLTCIVEQYRWTWSEYGEFFFLGGVGFVHAALNRLGKTYGGKNSEQTIANDAVFDMAIGHSHVGRSWRAPKIGPSQFVNVVNLGCALPQNHIEDYAMHATTGWTWGVFDLLIGGGHIQSASFVGMPELERRYS